MPQRSTGAQGTAPPGMVTLGHVCGVYGVHGWVRVHSYTEPRENIAGYDPWYLYRDGAWQPVRVLEVRRHGKGVVALLEGCADRDQAAMLQGVQIAVPREGLPATAPDEFYWHDLQGLRVYTMDGVELGVVDHLLATGANDVLVVHGERERLIPFVQGPVVVDVDLEARCIRVNWDPQF